MLLLHSLKLACKIFFAAGKHVADKIDESRVVVCDHLTNPSHSKTHRRTVGVMIIMIGVVVSKMGGDMYVLHLCCDALGYGIHGLGLVPFIGSVEKH